MSFWAAGAALVGTIGGSLLGNKGAKDAAKIAADKDTLTTDYSEDFVKQIQESISKLDKDVAEQMFGTSDTAEIMTQFQNSINQSQSQQTQQTEQVTQRGNAQQQAALDDTIAQLQAGGPSAQAAMDAAMNRVLRSGMPVVAGMGNRAGTFGDTNTALLQNDLAVKAAEAGAGVQLQQQNQNVQSLLQALGVGQAGTETTTGTGQTAASTTEQGQQQTTGESSSSTETSQDRTAQESQTNTTNTSSEQETTSGSKQFTDVGSDTSINPMTDLNINDPLRNLIGGVGTGEGMQLVNQEPAAPVVGPIEDPLAGFIPPGFAAAGGGGSSTGSKLNNIRKKADTILPGIGNEQGIGDPTADPLDVIKKSFNPLKKLFG